MKEVFLIRGVSGSGKSTLASALTNDTSKHIESDMYFVKDGVYEYKPDEVKYAHKDCFALFMLNVLRTDITRVIVSNTFTMFWEIEPYINFAKQHNCKLTVLTVEKCHNSVNVHGVPEETLKRQHERFQRIGGY